jgi:hypothetical protein
MKKGKILIVGLIALLMVGGLVLVGCEALGCYGDCGKIVADCSSSCAGQPETNSSTKPCSQSCSQK